MTSQTQYAQRGFTLLELTLAIGILSMLSVGIFAVASGAIEVSAEVAEFDVAETTRSRFIQVCRANIEELPPSGDLLLRQAGSERLPATSELSIGESPLAFSFGAGEGRAARTVLNLLPDGAGGVMARAYYLDRENAVRYEEGASVQQLEAPWINLVRGIRWLEWRFFVEGQRRWVDTWEEPNIRPKFVELNLQMIGESRPQRTVFWVPPRRVPPQFNRVDGDGDDGGDGETQNPGEEEGDPQEIPQIPQTGLQNAR